MRCVLASFAFMLSALSSAAATRPSLTSAEDNAAYAAAEFCAPYVLDGAEDTPPPKSEPLMQRDDWKEPAFSGLVQRRASASRASCTPQGGNGTAAGTARSWRARAIRRPCARRSLPLSPRVRKASPPRARIICLDAWATEDSLCTRADSRAPNAYVLLSAAPPESGLAIIFTMATSVTRMESCDHPGVRMNYRSLAPDQG